MSMLASVVSDGSPGSILLMEDSSFPFWLPLTPSAEGMVRVRGRLDGGTPVESAPDFFDFPPDEAAPARAEAVAAADSSPSSPEASREDGWSCSAVDSLDAAASGAADVFDELRFRLFAGEEDVGGAIVRFLGRRWQIACDEEN